MFDEPASTPAARAATTSLQMHVVTRTAAGNAGSLLMLEPPRGGGLWGSRRTSWTPLPEGARGSGAISHAVLRTASTPPEAAHSPSPSSVNQVIVIVWLCSRQSPTNSEAEISP